MPWADASGGPIYSDMARIIVIAAALVITACAPSPSIEIASSRPAAYAPLQSFVGRWTVKGREAAFVETCDWYHGGFHIVCNSENRRADGSLGRGMSLIGYLADEWQVDRVARPHGALHGAGSAVHRRDLDGRRAVGPRIDDHLREARLAPAPQLFSRYPVLKIHAAIPRQIAKNASVIAKLTSTLTSAEP